MTRALVLASLLFGSSQLQLRAQEAPAADSLPSESRSMVLEEFLIDVGSRFGIAIFAEEPLEELIAVPAQASQPIELLNNVLSRHSYLLLYSGPWSGPVATSPNRLHIFSAQPEGRTRMLYAEPAESGDDTVRTPPIDAIARIDSIFEAHPGNQQALISQLALEIETASAPEIREEAIFALAQFDARLARDALIQALADESADVRAAAAMAIAEQGFGGASDAIRIALADSNAAVREAAADALVLLE